MRSVSVHAVLLVVSLVLAWVVWSREEAGESRETAEIEEANVVLFDLRPDSVKGISFESERRRVKIAISGRGEKRVFDVSTYRRDERRRPRPRPRPRPRRDGGAADAGLDAGPAKAADAGPEVEIVETEKRFAGSEKLAEYFEKIAPLMAKRGFGEVSDETLAEFELDEPRASIEIRAGDRAHTLEVGGSTFGSSDTYVRDARTKRVFLVGAALVRDLEFGETRFMQRDLVRAEREDIVKAVVSAGGKRRTLVQQNRTKRREASWTDEASPRTRNELYDNWMGRLLRLRALEYLGPDEEPSAEGMSAPPTPVLEVEYFGEEGSLGKVELVKIEGESPDYFGRSDATRSWVKLSASLGDQVERDVESVLQ